MLFFNVYSKLAYESVSGKDFSLVGIQWDKMEISLIENRMPILQNVCIVIF